MKQAEFEQAVKAQFPGTAGTLEAWQGTSDTLIGSGQDVPDGGAWAGSDGQPIPIAPGFAPGSRVMVRNYCMWIEFTLPSGQKGIQISAHGPNADRFL